MSRKLYSGVHLKRKNVKNRFAVEVEADVGKVVAQRWRPTRRPWFLLLRRPMTPSAASNVHLVGAAQHCIRRRLALLAPPGHRRQAVASVCNRARANSRLARAGSCCIATVASCSKMFFSDAQLVGRVRRRSVQLQPLPTTARTPSGAFEKQLECAQMCLDTNLPNSEKVAKVKSKKVFTLPLSFQK